MRIFAFIRFARVPLLFGVVLLAGLGTAAAQPYVVPPGSLGSSPLSLTLPQEIQAGASDATTAVVDVSGTQAVRFISGTRVRLLSGFRARNGSDFKAQPAGPAAAIPTPPPNLAISELGSTTATLTWNASGDDVGVTGYEIFVNGVSRGTVSGLTTTITGLSELTVYQFSVRARDADGNWSSSSSRSVKTWQRLLVASGTITGQWEWDEEQQENRWYGSADCHTVTAPSAGTLRIYTTGTTDTAIWTGSTGSGSGGVGGNALLIAQVGAGSNGIYVGGDADGVTGSYQVFVDFKPAAAAVFAASPAVGRAPLTVNFDATNSSDPDNPPTSIAWDFENDGTTDAASLVTSRTYANTSSALINYTAKLTVTGGGTTSTLTKVIPVYPADSRAIVVQGGTSSVPYQMTGSTVTLTASEVSVFNVFSNWTIVSGSGSLADANATTTTFTVGSSDVVVRANYTLDTSQVHVTTYSTPGSYQYSLPAGASSITVKAWGAGGGMSYSSGGAGAFGSATFAPSVGQSIGVVVGAGGNGGYASSNSSASYSAGPGGASSVTIISGVGLSAGGGLGGGTTAGSNGTPGSATASGSVGAAPVLLSGTGATPPNTSDSAYPGSYVAYGSGGISYGFADSSGWFQYGAPGYRGHVVVTAYAMLPPAITSNLAAAGTRGAAFNYSITASGSPTAYSATGLPYGLVVNPSTGAITGSTNKVGTFNATIIATNLAGSGAATLVLTVNPPAPSFTSGSSAAGTAGEEFTYSLTATESPTGYGLTGTLPTGLTLNSTTGLISGTPTQYGTFNLSAQATNAGGTGTASFALTINPPVPVVTSATTAAATVGSSFSYTITATNSPASYAVSSLLPAGLSLNSSTGVIGGTPTEAGVFNVILRATNVTGTGTSALTLTVNGPPVVRSRPSIVAIGGLAFSYRIFASNAPTSFSVTGTLPAGLSLNTSTGVISGTPSASGTFNLSLGATNAYGTGSASVTLTVLADSDGDGIPDQVESLLNSNQSTAASPDSTNQTLQFKVQRPAQ